ncbi:hypothetical protein [Snodgrassella sp. CS2]|uniref:hypothetical protein n=1 Tax=Snodgrassella sp. CS2 TaxID=3418953 RepID=UPI003D074A03
MICTLTRFSTAPLFSDIKKVVAGKKGMDRNVEISDVNIESIPNSPVPIYLDNAKFKNW